MFSSSLLCASVTQYFLAVRDASFTHWVAEAEGPRLRGYSGRRTPTSFAASQIALASKGNAVAWKSGSSM